MSGVIFLCFQISDKWRIEHKFGNIFNMSVNSKYSRSSNRKEWHHVQTARNYTFFQQASHFAVLWDFSLLPYIMLNRVWIQINEITFLVGVWFWISWCSLIRL